MGCSTLSNVGHREKTLDAGTPGIGTLKRIGMLITEDKYLSETIERDSLGRLAMDKEAEWLLFSPENYKIALMHIERLTSS